MCFGLVEMRTTVLPLDIHTLRQTQKQKDGLQKPEGIKKLTLKTDFKNEFSRS